MRYKTEDTIFALASGAGRSGIAVIRLSGPDVLNVYERLCPQAGIPVLWRAKYVSFHHPKDGRLMDKGLVLYFKGPRSFTGEDVLEFHVHGGGAVISLFLETLSEMDGLRAAEPGEFSKRAFINGKMDLTGAEGLLDLIHAETERQREQALLQMTGTQSAFYGRWANDIKRNLAHIEAYIDFPEEEIPTDVLESIQTKVNETAGEIRDYLSQSKNQEKLREGFKVALIGAPNAGKSSLLNGISKRDAAIVSATPGTTRDIIEIFMDLNGYPVILADTAGVRETEEEIEREGVSRALKKAKEADLIVLVLDGTTYPDLDPEIERLGQEQKDKTIVLVNKKDLMETPPSELKTVSAKTGEGIPELLKTIQMRAENMFSFGETPAITRVRYRESLEKALFHLARRPLSESDVELFAEELRLSLRAIGRITGETDVEDLLDIVFSSFCIGK